MRFFYYLPIPFFLLMPFVTHCYVTLQELCHASLADALEVSLLHDKSTRRPHMASHESICSSTCDILPRALGAESPISRLRTSLAHHMPLLAAFQNIVLAILEGVISGLEFLHQEGLAHGNLK